MANEYLARTPSVAGNRKTFTISTWLKRAKIGTGGSNRAAIFSAGNTASVGGNGFHLWHFNDFLGFEGNGGGNLKRTTAVFRDTAAWYHIVCAVDTTQSTATNRIRLYVNGSEITSFSDNTAMTQGIDTAINNSSVPQYIGVSNDDGSLTYYQGGLLSDFFLVDGQQLTPSVFGATDSTTGQWEPRPPAAIRTAVGSFGTNGFYLPFTNNTSTATLGYDYKTADRSSNNDFTPNNLSTNDGFPDGVSNNFCTLNADSFFGTRTMSDGNLRILGGNDGFATFGLTSGKWYWEMQRTNTGEVPHWGIVSAHFSRSTNGLINGTYAGSILIRHDYGTGGGGGGQFNNGFGISSISGELGTIADTANGDIITFHLDLDSTPKTIKMYKNGASGTPICSRTFTYAPVNGNVYQIFPFARNNDAAETLFNFGQGTTGSNYADSNGYGRFNYQPPSGFLAICEKNVTNPTITKPNLYFDILTYTGNGSTQNITGLNFQPDLVWVKSRSNSSNNSLYDSVRGAGNALFSNTAEVEATGVNDMTGFLSNGISVAYNARDEVNRSGYTYAAWCWKAGDSTVTNTAGTISSQVRANTTAGFSIVTWTGNGVTGATVGHGLGAVPAMIICKERNGTDYWHVKHRTSASNTNLFLNVANASTSASSVGDGILGDLTSSTTFGFATAGSPNNVVAVNQSGINNVAYCWAEVPGFSKFGGYTGNGSADGPFIHCGFRPKFVMCKIATGGTNVWLLLDSTRNPDNTVTFNLNANDGAAQNTGSWVNFFSNGFKVINASDSAINTLDATYIFMAFADSPQDFANAR
jgi:hypothetical protein